MRFEAERVADRLLPSLAFIKDFTAPYLSLFPLHQRSENIVTGYLLITRCGNTAAALALPVQLKKRRELPPRQEILRN